MSGGLELASKKTKLAATCGLQLRQRRLLVGTCSYGRSRGHSKFMLHAAAHAVAVDSNARIFLRDLRECMLDLLVVLVFYIGGTRNFSDHLPDTLT